MKRTHINWAALLLLSGAASLAQAQDARRPYIVQLADAPAASYVGGVAGYAATRPAVGSRLDLSASAVQVSPAGTEPCAAGGGQNGCHGGGS